jgi:hypothetical protein
VKEEDDESFATKGIRATPQQLQTQSSRRPVFLSSCSTGNHPAKRLQVKNIYRREAKMFQHVEMPVVGNYTRGAAVQGAVHELVVVMVCGYQAPFKVRRNHYGMRRMYDKAHRVFCNMRRIELRQQLLIFKQNVGRATQIVTTLL